MNFIQHTLEFDKLFLAWQGESDPNHLKYVVAELTLNTNHEAQLVYLDTSEDFTNAKRFGFNGYPAFSIDRSVHTDGILDAFLRRIPSRKREDFNKYLEALRLSSDENISDFSLLGYSGAKLPGDSFSLIPYFDNQNGDFEILIDIAGFRYKSIDINTIPIGAQLSFEPDPTSSIDRHAIKVMMNGVHIGFIPRTLLATFNNWLANNRIENAFIERKNGHIDKPVLYMFIKVRSK